MILILIQKVDINVLHLGENQTLWGQKPTNSILTRCKTYFKCMKTDNLLLTFDLNWTYIIQPLRDT